jgi:glucose-6-phosphate 1-dehydrogenase
MVSLGPNVLRFGLEPESVALELTGTGPRADTLAPLILTADTALSIRADEAEESWRVVTPVLDAWSKGLVRLNEYPAGSDGPPDP